MPVYFLESILYNLGIIFLNVSLNSNTRYYSYHTSILIFYMQNWLISKAIVKILKT
jgi:hypothetical protein